MQKCRTLISRLKPALNNSNNLHIEDVCFFKGQTCVSAEDCGSIACISAEEMKQTSELHRICLCFQLVFQW